MKTKRILSVIIAMSMFLSIIPMTISAEEPILEEVEFILGDINGDGVITVIDALEIMKYVAGVDNAIDRDGGKGSRAWNAALITGGDELTLKDAFEIICYRANTPSILNGVTDPVWADAGLDVEIELIEGEKFEGQIVAYVKYYTTADIERPGRVHFEIDTHGFPNAFLFNPFLSLFPMASIDGNNLYVAFPEDNLSTDNFDEDHFIWSFPDKLIFGPIIPAGTEFMQRVLRVDSINELDITGNSISSVSISTRTLGQVRGEGKVSINDALEILKHLAGIDSVIDNCEIALMASLIVSEGKPTIADVLEILKHLAGIPNKIG
jgi:hypothetical protein